MGDEPTRGDVAAHGCRDEEVANCVLHEQLQCLYPGEEDLHRWEQAEDRRADQHEQLGAAEGSPLCPELHQELSPEGPADHDSGNQTEGFSNRGEETPPWQGGPEHIATQQDTASQAPFHKADGQGRKHRQIREPCWYCMKSLNTDTLKKLQLDFESLGLSPKGKQFSYQQDPRPHFGVAHSSRSTPFPLWGCEGPLRRQRRVEDGDQMGACPHCHLALPMDTLRWHEAKCLMFDGLKTPCGKVAK